MVRPPLREMLHLEPQGLRSALVAETFRPGQHGIVRRFHGGLHEAYREAVTQIDHTDGAGPDGHDLWVRQGKAEAEDDIGGGLDVGGDLSLDPLRVRKVVEFADVLDALVLGNAVFQISDYLRYGLLGRFGLVDLGHEDR